MDQQHSSDSNENTDSNENREFLKHHPELCKCSPCTCTPEQHCGCFDGKCRCNDPHMDHICPPVDEELKPYMQ